MPRAKKPKLWESAFRRVKALHWPQFIYPPRTTASDLDAVEQDLDFRFPASYRAFAEEFGLGGTLGCSLPRILPLLRPAWGDQSPSAWFRSVVDATNFYHTFNWSRYTRNVSDSELPFFRRAVLFAMDSGYHDWVFDPDEVTDVKLREYRIYDVSRQHQISAIADSFPEWLAWLRQHYVLEKEEEAGPEPLEFPPVYKPDSPHADAMIYDRDSDHRRRKKAPAERRVKLWLAYNDNTVRDLARSIRDGHPEAFPVLADALEEAGCTNADLLGSCRHGDPDIDGVWVLRVLLGG